MPGIEACSKLGLLAGGAFIGGLDADALGSMWKLLVDGSSLFRRLPFRFVGCDVAEKLVHCDLANLFVGCLIVPAKSDPGWDLLV